MDNYLIPYNQQRNLRRFFDNDWWFTPIQKTIASGTGIANVENL